MDRGVDFAVDAVADLGAADAPVDAPVDTPPDVPAWTSPWDFVTELVVHSTEPCEDWEVIEAPSELPPDPTPELLWGFEIGRDPLGYNERGFSSVIHMALSPSGLIWARGPERESRALMAVRDGRIVWRQDDVSLGGELAAAPDGSVFQRGECFGLGPDDPEGVGIPTDADYTLLQITPDFRQRTLLLPESASNCALNRMALGPEGRVYSLGREAIVATCGVDHVLWELRLEAKPGADWREWMSLVVDSRGTLWARAGRGIDDAFTTGMFEVDPSGSVSRRIPADPTEQGRTHLHGPWSDEPRFLVEERTARTLVRFGEQVGDAPVEWWTETLPYFGETVPDEPRHTPWMGARGELWLFSRENWTVRYAEPLSPLLFAERWLRPGLVFTRAATRLLITGGGSTDGYWTGTTAEGIEEWRAPTPHGVGLEVGGRTYAGNGVLYVAGGQSMYAVQTDALPPENTCVTWGCNARHNWWIGSP
ncbi:MAG: hypothetical protein GY944_23065 [bacterium]|nr:hypothetical protein [bacterium]